MEVSVGGAVEQPGNAEKEKKSGWRNSRPVVTDKCTGCSFCVVYCPEGGMSVEGKKAVINYNYCKGCMICMQVCPLKAIASEKEK
jgi:pyruvate ferredoxin oxidoreductase delta subunit